MRAITLIEYIHCMTFSRSSKFGKTNSVSFSLKPPLGKPYKGSLVVLSFAKTSLCKNLPYVSSKEKQILLKMAFSSLYLLATIAGGSDLDNPGFETGLLETPSFLNELCALLTRNPLPSPVLGLLVGIEEEVVNVGEHDSVGIDKFGATLGLSSLAVSLH